MKNLKELFEASILADIEDTIATGNNPYKLLYPTPKLSDFKKGRYLGKGASFLKWECKELIQNYINDYKCLYGSAIKHHLAEFTKLRFIISSDGKVDVDFETESDAIVMHMQLYGVGKYEGSEMNTKKAIIRFIDKITDDPSNMKKVIDFSNKSLHLLNMTNHCDYESFDKIIK